LEFNKSKYEDTKVELKDNIDEKISDMSDSVDEKISEMSDSIYAELSTFRLWADTQFSNVDTELRVLLFLVFINIILSAFILIKMGLR
jgi:hypothetical protein